MEQEHRTDVHPFLVADFGDDVGRQEWTEFGAFEAWASYVQNEFAWLADLGLSATSTANSKLISGLAAAVAGFRAALNSKTHNLDEQFSEQFAVTKSAFEGLVRANPWLLQGQAAHLFLKSLRESGKTLEAGLIVAAFLDVDLNDAPIRPLVWSLVKLELFKRGIQGRVESEIPTLARLAVEHETKLKELAALERTQDARFREKHDQHTAQSERQQTSFDSAQSERATTWATHVSNAKEEFARLESAYDAHMSLAAPVKYWEAKQARHRNWVFWSGAVILIAMALSGWLLHSEIQSFGNDTHKTMVRASGAVAKSASTQSASSATSSVQPASSAGLTATIGEALEIAPTWRLGSLLLLATLCFWLLRLLVRIFLSNMHLENDAAERVTMAKTYLALLRKGRLPDKDDVSLVLAALFRPSGDGLVKDEGVPLTCPQPPYQSFGEGPGLQGNCVGGLVFR